MAVDASAGSSVCDYSRPCRLVSVGFSPAAGPHRVV